jgi:hypothetical protein
VLDLAEVQAYGRDSYGNADYVCDWSNLKVYDLLARGSNHGILLATCRWRPAVDADAAT